MMEPIYRPGKTHNVSYPAGSLLVGPQTITATITQEGVTDASTAINVPEIHDIELAQANLKPNTIYELTVDVCVNNYRTSAMETNWKIKIQRISNIFQEKKWINDPGRALP